VSGPYDAEWIEWDDGNLAEVAAHRISDMEVEQVFDGGPLFLRNKRQGSGDYKMVGRTRGGRALVVIVRWFPDRRTLRPITAGDATQSDERYL